MDTPLKRTIADESLPIEQRRAAFQEFNRQQQKCDKCQTPGTYRAGRCSGCISESQVQEQARVFLEDAGMYVRLAREWLEQIPGEWTGDECGRIESEIAGTVRNLHAKAMMPE
jgi:hypothetical protein